MSVIRAVCLSVFVGIAPNVLLAVTDPAPTKPMKVAFVVSEGVNVIDLAGPWERIRFVEALERHELWTRDPAELRAWLTERGVDTDADKDWTQLVDHAFSHFVEPGLIQPTIVHDYPVQLSPFARPTDDDPTLTERFEYFAGGMELGNAFTEINEAAMQQARFEQQSEQVEGERGDPDYVEALSYGMPPTGGLGFGIDRFVMLLTGKESIRDVVLFPALRAVRD